jgi:predicted DNA-binding transcriptional regulator AlpA
MTLPAEGLVRLPTVLCVVPFKRSAWWKGVKEGRFPKPVRIAGTNVTAWRVEEIRALLEQFKAS